jgi:hypothetical protein
MNDTATTIERLLEKSNELKNGPQRIEVLTEAVRLADEHGLLDDGFTARLKLMDAATFGDRPDLLLTAFAWCLTQHDRDPDRFDPSDLLWKYKWVVGNAAEFPDIPRERIEAMLADMADRFEKAGSTLHAVHQLRREVLADMGDLAGAAQATARLAATKRDWLSDCRACVCDITAGHLADQERDAEALEAAAPILAGRVKCTHVPHRTYAQLLLPLLRLGRRDDALHYHQEGCRLIGDDPEFLAAAARHLEFLAVIGDFDQAIEVLQTHLPNALGTPSVHHRMKFFGAVWLFLVMLSEQDPSAIRLRLPATFALFDPRGVYVPAALMEWFGKETKTMATQFDARNGNDHYMRWFARRWR